MFLGRPRFLLPCGFQSRAERAMLCGLPKSSKDKVRILLVFATAIGEEASGGFWTGGPGVPMTPLCLPKGHFG